MQPPVCERFVYLEIRTICVLALIHLQVFSDFYLCPIESWPFVIFFWHLEKQCEGRRVMMLLTFPFFGV